MIAWLSSETLLKGYRRNRKEAEATDETEAKPQSVLIGFRVVYVFDLSQTEGAELPEMEHNVSGSVGDHRDRLIDFLGQQNIALEISEKIAPALGVSYGGKIALLPGQSRAEEFTTLVHETAHELLHKAERRTMTTATVRETEAEAVAFIVGQPPPVPPLDNREKRVLYLLIIEWRACGRGQSRSGSRNAENAGAQNAGA